MASNSEEEEEDGEEEPYFSSTYAVEEEERRIVRLSERLGACCQGGGREHGHGSPQERPRKKQQQRQSHGAGAALAGTGAGADASTGAGMILTTTYRTWIEGAPTERVTRTIIKKNPDGQVVPETVEDERDAKAKKEDLFDLLGDADGTEGKDGEDSGQATGTRTEREESRGEGKDMAMPRMYWDFHAEAKLWDGVDEL
ncbi:hypothetical protein MKZ38_002804 [Zalerion maritima]|uniref:Uncharacterized protein n=1 Tax=Zalerion maritima TaxID=339359 RepID=A0AAD5RNE7_9PEZI|nr:hypothetical protein MKZ38_002804 [Zalerion maritima]